VWLSLESDEHRILSFVRRYINSKDRQMGEGEGGREEGKSKEGRGRRGRGKKGGERTTDTCVFINVGLSRDV